MAKWIWLLHCIAQSFEPSVSIFQVSRGSIFSGIYMANVAEERVAQVANSPENDVQRVVSTVVPGFKIGETIIQCQSYLLDSKLNRVIWPF